MSCIRYSPHPISHYGMSGGSKLLTSDEAAWNLAYLSWDVENQPLWPDPYFSTHVRRSIQFVLDTGVSDVTGTTEDCYTVRGFMTRPAPEAVAKIVAMAHLKQLPLFRAYGEKWLDTLQARARNWREVHDERFDFAVPDCSQALALIRICQKAAKT